MTSPAIKFSPASSYFFPLKTKYSPSPLPLFSTPTACVLSLIWMAMFLIHTKHIRVVFCSLLITFLGRREDGKFWAECAMHSSNVICSSPRHEYNIHCYCDTRFCSFPHFRILRILSLILMTRHGHILRLRRVHFQNCLQTTVRPLRLSIFSLRYSHFHQIDSSTQTSNWCVTFNIYFWLLVCDFWNYAL